MDFKAFFDALPKSEPPLEAAFPTRTAYLKAKVRWRNESDRFGRRNGPATPEDIEKLKAHFAPHDIPEFLLDLYREWNGESWPGGFKPQYQLNAIESVIEMSSVLEAEAVYPLAHSSFFAIFTVEKTEVGIFLNDANRNYPVYYRDVWEMELGLLAPSLADYFTFLLEANVNGIYAKRKITSRDPFKYLATENALMDKMFPGFPAAPIKRRRGVSTFDILGKKNWPQSIPLAYGEEADSL